MSEGLSGVVISHAGVGDALIEAVASISGEREALVPVSNEGCGRAELNRRLRDAVGGRPTLVFVDMAGGSCFMAAGAVLRDCPNTRVISGVNLPMLLEFVFHRDDDLDVAADRARRAGQDAVRVMDR